MSDSDSSQFSADPTVGGELRLPRPPGVIRRFWARHHRAADAILAIFLGLAAGTGAIGPISRGFQWTWPTFVAIGMILVSVTGVFVRRTRPLLTVMLSSASIVALLWSPSEMVLLPAIFAVYAAAAHHSARAGSIAAAAMWSVSTLAATAGVLLLPESRGLLAAANAEFSDLSAVQAVLAFASQFGVLLALSLAIGINIGNRRRYLAALIERARQLAVERDQQGKLATAMERARIAREMHDIVSHSLTVMIALAEGSAVAAASTAPDAASAMQTVADTGRGAMVDMRRMLGVLGGDDASDADIAPQPGFTDLPALIDSFRTSGLPVVFRGNGPQPSDPAIQLAVYRLIQESLTNALRYAHGPTQVLVSVTVTDDALTASIVDNGLAGFDGSDAESVGGGRGLIGLRERLATVGGTLTAGPRTDSAGWAVHAQLKLHHDARDDRP